MKIYSYKKGSISYEKNLIQALDIDLEKDKINQYIFLQYFNVLLTAFDYF